MDLSASGQKNQNVVVSFSVGPDSSWISSQLFYQISDRGRQLIPSWWTTVIDILPPPVTPVTPPVFCDRKATSFAFYDGDMPGPVSAEEFLEHFVINSRTSNNQP